MSDTELDQIHAKSSAIFEELYDAKGQPGELDEAFTQEYFGLVKNSVDTDLVNAELFGPRGTQVKLSRSNGGLIDVVIPDKNEKFLVSNLTSVKTLSGRSQRMGPSRGKGSYIMTSVKGVPNITIRTSGSIVTFIGFPNTVKTETGSGEWVKM